MIKLPSIAVEHAGKFIREQVESVSGIRQISFVTSSLAASQLGFILTRNLNHELEINPYTEFSVYSITSDPLMVQPKFAIYNGNECLNLNTPLIATDIASWNIVNNSYSPYKYFYIYDVAILSKVSPEIIKQIRESKFCVFTRTKAHAQFISQQFGIKSFHIYVPNFEIDGIMEIINETSR